MNQDLMIDGYIATTFSPQDAETYYCILLRRNPHFLQPSIHNGIFYAMPPHRPDLDPRQPQTPWVIDHMVWNRGTVIGQQIWATRNQYELLSPPIFFVHRNGALGLPLIQAAGGDCITHAQIRIGWRGYRPWDDQIMIRTQTPRREIIQLEKFVKHVARK
ncbi:hypothetical protein H4582DRAFT_2045436 [Lactarius indigo]|nr:hypothetical protein H4582DRAFT_2045436 [Lactarius indigo]